MGESLEVASCGCSCSWQGEGPLGGSAMKYPLGSQRQHPPPRRAPEAWRPPQLGTVTASWEPLAPLCPPNCSFLFHHFFTNNCVHHVAPDLGSLASVPRPSRGAGLVSPAQPSSTPWFTSPLLCPRWAPPQPRPESEGRIRLPILPARDGYSVMAHKSLHSPS